MQLCCRHPITGRGPGRGHGGGRNERPRCRKGTVTNERQVQMADHNPTLADLVLPARLVRRTIRRAAGLTLTEVGRLVDPADPVDRSVVSRWERITDPTGHRRAAYAAVLREIERAVV